jgi:hypothetical protein
MRIQSLSNIAVIFHMATVQNQNTSIKIGSVISMEPQEAYQSLFEVIDLMFQAIQRTRRLHGLMLESPPEKVEHALLETIVAENKLISEIGPVIQQLKEAIMEGDDAGC